MVIIPDLLTFIKFQWGNKIINGTNSVLAWNYSLKQWMLLPAVIKHE
jgi:hypothetical protein